MTEPPTSLLAVSFHLMVAMRWAHILAAIVMMGGAFYMRFTLVPSLSVLSDESRSALMSAIRGRWARVVMLSSGLLLLSGLFNVMVLTKFDFSSRLFHPLLGVKILLAMIVFFLASALSGRSRLAERLRENLSFWLSLNLLLAVVVVCLAGVLRLIDRTPKAEPQSSLDARAAIVQVDR